MMTLQDLLPLLRQQARIKACLAKRSKRVAALFVLISVLTGFAPTAIAQQYTHGAVHQHWSIPLAWNVDTYVWPSVVSDTVFFAQQFRFENTPNGDDGAYMGLQQINGTTNRLAIFSVWNATAANAGPGATCSDFGGEGIGKKCLVPYAFQIGRWYNLRVWRLNADPQGQWWGAWVIDDEGNETHIANIRAPLGTGQINSLTNFDEFWGPALPCGQLPHSAFYVYQPIVNGGNDRATIGSSNLLRCSAGSVTSLSNGRMSRLALRDTGGPPSEGIYRLTSGWHAESSYLNRRGVSNGQGGWNPGREINLITLNGNSERWTSMRWALEPAHDGWYRLRNQWGSDTGYLTRVGERHGSGWRPTNRIRVYEKHDDWSSQLWRLEPAHSGSYRIVNGWGDDGYINRRGLRNVDGTYRPSSEARLFSKQNWGSQMWTLHAVGTTHPLPPIVPGSRGLAIDLMCEQSFEICLKPSAG